MTEPDADITLKIIEQWNSAEVSVTKNTDQQSYLFFKNYIDFKINLYYDASNLNHKLMILIINNKKFL